MKTPTSCRSLRPRQTLPALFLLATVSVVAPVFAQRNGGANRPNGNRNQMAPQQNDRVAQMMERMLKMQLQNAGYTDENLQNAVVTYVKNKETARQPLYAAANALAQSLSNTEAGAQETNTALATFNAALEAERDRTKKAEKELDTQIKYSSDAKLRAALVLGGIIGDAGSYLSSPMAGRPMPPGGMQGGPEGSPGGGFDGGPMSGPGGQMGGPNGQMGGPGGPPPGGDMDDFPM